MVGLNFLLSFLLSFSLTVCQGQHIVPNLLSYKDSAAIDRPVKTLSDWKKKRHQIIEGMEKAMGQLPDRSALPDFDMQITETLQRDTYTRLTINFKVAKNERVPAYLYVPIQNGKKERLPAMLALHETELIGKESVDGQGPRPNLAYAKELAERGYVVIAPDYPGFGDLSDYNFKTSRYQSGTMKSIFDDMRCIDLLQARSDVDPNRIGVIGHSLGGHSAMFVGAFDTRIKVIVSNCGWTLFNYDNLNEVDLNIKRYGGREGDWATEEYMPLLKEKYNLDTEKFPFDFDEVIAAFAPRAFFSSSPLGDNDFNVGGVRVGIAEASEVYRFFGAGDNLQVRYPAGVHDFIPESRKEAYRFIDKVLGFTPNKMLFR